nr:MAG TPA: protein of unknown function DUF2407 [Caudoviricetes sp.]
MKMNDVTATIVCGLFVGMFFALIVIWVYYILQTLFMV